MFQALAFVPPDKVLDAFLELMDNLDPASEEQLDEWLTYFEKVWIGEVKRGRRRSPLFQQSLWNVHLRVKDNLPRTNNSLEGWHRGFDMRIAITHPTKQKLIYKIRKEQDQNELLLEQLLAGMTIRPRSKKYELINIRIISIVENFDRYSILDFLRAIAHNL